MTGMTAGQPAPARRRPRRQPDLFPDTVTTRRYRVLMHVRDAGDVPGLGAAVVMRCRRCGLESGWVKERSVTEEKRGRPCPVCNPADREARELAVSGGYAPDPAGGDRHG